jgi:hypothetical protein
MHTHAHFFPLKFLPLQRRGENPPVSPRDSWVSIHSWEKPGFVREINNYSVWKGKLCFAGTLSIVNIQHVLLGYLGLAAHCLWGILQHTNHRKLIVMQSNPGLQTYSHLVWYKLNWLLSPTKEKASFSSIGTSISIFLTLTRAFFSFYFSEQIVTPLLIFLLISWIKSLTCVHF